MVIIIRETERPGEKMPKRLFRFTVLAALFAGAAGVADAATFELARKPDGTIIRGLRIEGDIVPGDAQRLLDAYAKYGTQVSPVYLRSMGGDVEEAMRMGVTIRRLRWRPKLQCGLKDTR